MNFLSKNTICYEPPEEKLKGKNPLKNKLLSRKNFSRENSGRASSRRVTDYSQMNLGKCTSSRLSNANKSDISSFEVERGVAEIHKTRNFQGRNASEKNSSDLIGEQEFYRAKQMKHHRLGVDKKSIYGNSRGFPQKRPISATSSLLKVEKGFKKRPLTGRVMVQHRPSMRILRERASKDTPNLEVHNGCHNTRNNEGIDQMQLKNTMKYITGQMQLAKDYLSKKALHSQNQYGFRSQAHTSIKTVGGFVKVNPKARLKGKENSCRNSVRSGMDTRQASKDLTDVMYDIKINTQGRPPSGFKGDTSQRKVNSEENNPVLKPNITKGKYKKESSEYLSKADKKTRGKK
ncbi:unnamed protein product [Moneuplotes crassus]|uniref:Uncharacterized protein n=1 Tax=Euplotes crassus TaxID=5936 RepID=A0AAD1UL45_EUPCR|nr:unnamed protein product [Moneuplotes crassus]